MVGRVAALALWTAVGLGSLAVGYVAGSPHTTAEEVADFRSHGIEQTADVTSTHEGDVEIEWTYLDREYTGGFRVPSSGKYDEGDPVEIIIDEDDPSRMVPAFDTGWLWGDFFAVTLLAFTAAFIVLAALDKLWRRLRPGSGTAPEPSRVRTGSWTASEPW